MLGTVNIDRIERIGLSINNSFDADREISFLVRTIRNFNPQGLLVILTLRMSPHNLSVLTVTVGSLPKIKSLIST